MIPVDRTLAPEVTDEELERALDAEVLPFPDVDEQDEPDEERGLLAVAPNTPAEALAVAKRYTDTSIFVGVGMCLKTVRTYFAVPSLWPDASTAMDHSAPFHKLTDPLKAPRGSVGFAETTGRHDHTWLNLGGGLVRTTDMHRAGKVDVALMSRMLEWCGATSFGWGETLNGFDVWPDHPKPKPPPEHDFHAWQWERRVKFLRAEAVRQKRDGHEHRAEQLSEWADKIAARHR